MEKWRCPNCGNEGMLQVLSGWASLDHEDDGSCFHCWNMDSPMKCPCGYSGIARDFCLTERKEEFPEITTVDLAISAALDEGFMSVAGSKLMAIEIQDLRALLYRASMIMSERAASQVKAETIWRKDLADRGMA